MNAREGLLAAILANPADDTPRLVYADLIDDEGEHHRAEFIRIQCELESLPYMQHCVQVLPGSTFISTIHGPNGEAYHYWNQTDGAVMLRFDADFKIDPHMEKRQKLERREKELFVTAGPGQREWFGDAVHKLCRPGTDVDEFAIWFTRGFISSLNSTGEDSIAYGDDIIAQQPIEKVNLTTIPPFVVGYYSTLHKAYPANFHYDPKELTVYLKDTGVIAWLAMTPKMMTKIRLSALKERWQGIKFELPEVEEQAETVEVERPRILPPQGLIDALRERGDIGEGDLERIDPPMVYRRGDSTRMMHCMCQQRRPIAYFVDGEIAPDRVTYETIQLRLHRWSISSADPRNGLHTEFHWIGQCPRCRVIRWQLDHST